jgi:D-alanyl-D-alanine carboxypeptidase
MKTTFLTCLCSIALGLSVFGQTSTAPAMSASVQPSVPMIPAGPSPEVNTASVTPSAAPSASAPREPKAAIDALLRETYPGDKSGASVLVVHHNRVVLRGGYGLAQINPVRTVTPDVIFRIGSMTKQFTAVAILQLIDAGKLRLDSRVGQLLSETPPPWHDITVAQLLQHTSGLADPDLPDNVERDSRAMTVAEVLNLSRDLPATFAPGTDWKYSNTGFLVLGAIIERTSGLSYADYIKQHIAKAGGLNDTGYDAGDDDNPRRARGYQKGAKGGEQPADFYHMSQPYAAGALVSTVDDLWKWEKQLAAGHLLSRASLEKAWTTGRLPDGRETGYGYGWFISQVDGHRTHEHGGAINGFTSYSLAMPDEGLYVFLLSNRDANETPGVHQPAAIVLEIARTLLGPSKPVHKKIAPADLSSLTGVYRVDATTKRAITIENGMLYTQSTGRPRFPLTPLGGDHFVIAENDSHFFFKRDASGQVIGMRSRNRTGPERNAVRVDEPFTEKMPPALALSAEAMSRLAGKYEFAPNLILTVRHENEGLVAQMTGQPAFKLLAESATRFRLENVPAKIEFTLGPDGIATTANFVQGAHTMTGKRVAP